MILCIFRLPTGIIPMSKNVRAGAIKAALDEITNELVDQGRYTTRAAVKELRRRFKKVIDAEEGDVIEIGLNVLAGRVRAYSYGSEDQADLLKKSGLRKNERIAFRENGKIVKRVVNVLNLTAADYDPTIQKVTRDKVPKAKSIDNLEGQLSQMLEQGFNGTLRDFLGR
jgi:hypothetical protein